RTPPPAPAKNPYETAPAHCLPRRQKEYCNGSNEARYGMADVRFGSKADICSAQAHVRFGSLADICAATIDVRFTPDSDRKSGHVRCNCVCMLRAKSGHHSITSSARSKKDSRTERPRALAVLRLTASSNLSGDCNGRLPARSPLRMRSTYELERRKISTLSGP